MADGPKGGSAPAQPNYPKNWNKMTAGQKRAWQDQQGIKRPNQGQPTQPAKPPVNAPVSQQQNENYEENNEENNEEYKDEGTTLEQGQDEVRVCITFPGQDASQMSGRDFVRALLRGLCDGLQES